MLDPEFVRVSSPDPFAFKPCHNLLLEQICLVISATVGGVGSSDTDLIMATAFLQLRHAVDLNEF